MIAHCPAREHVAYTTTEAEGRHEADQCLAMGRPVIVRRLNALDQHRLPGALLRYEAHLNYIVEPI